MGTLRTLKISGRNYTAGQGYLDPVTAFLEDFEPGRGQLTVVCWGRPWSYFWGAMGPSTDLRTFLLGADTDYIVGKLSIPRGVLLRSVEKIEERWLEQITLALKDELRKPQEIAA